MNQVSIEILLLEDEPAHVALVRRAFSGESDPYELVVCSTLAEARHYLQSHVPSAAIVDMGLPDGRGTDLLTEGDQAARFPTIILTSQGSERAAVESIKAGALDYITKSPTSLLDMPQLVRRVMREWQLMADREQARRALADEEQRFRQMAEHIRDVFWMYDLVNRKVLYVSPAFEAIWGRPPSFLSEPPEVVLTAAHMEDRARVRLEPNEWTSTTVHDQVFRIVRPDGAIRWIHDRRFPITDPDGQIRRIVGVAEDVTDRQEASDKLQQQFVEMCHVARLSTMGELVAGIAHEVNQPLYAIANYSAAASDALRAGGELPIEQMRQWNDDISKAVTRAADVIKRIRAYVSKGPSQRVPTNISTLVEESIELVAIEARRSKVQVHLNVSRPSPILEVDPVAIQQVMCNVLLNAYEAMQSLPAESRVARVATYVEPRYVRIEISDNGPGLTPQVEQQLFVPFFTTKPSGMGMGLAISKTIVDAHGGDISARSNDRGTTIVVRLPLADADSARAAERQDQELAAWHM